MKVEINYHFKKIMPKKIKMGEYIGCYTALLVKCPNCGEFEYQYYSDTDPEEVETYDCEKCKKPYKIVLKDIEGFDFD